MSCAIARSRLPMQSGAPPDDGGEDAWQPAGKGSAILPLASSIQKPSRDGRLADGHTLDAAAVPPTSAATFSDAEDLL